MMVCLVLALCSCELIKIIGAVVHSSNFFLRKYFFSQRKVLNVLPTNLTIKFTLNELYSLCESETEIELKETNHTIERQSLIFRQ